MLLVCARWSPGKGRCGMSMSVSEPDEVADMKTIAEYADSLEAATATAVIASKLAAAAKTVETEAKRAHAETQAPLFEAQDEAQAAWATVDAIRAKIKECEGA